MNSVPEEDFGGGGSPRYHDYEQELAPPPPARYFDHEGDLAGPPLSGNNNNHHHNGSDAMRNSLAMSMCSASSGMESFDEDGELNGGRRSSLFQKTIQTSKNRKTSLFILGSLFLSCIVLTTTTFLLLRSSEQLQFETAFKIFAREATVVAEMHAENVFGQLQSLASALRSGMLLQQERYYHQVSIPDFDLRTEEITNLTGIELLMFVPFVPNDERQEFEEFQYNHQDWIVNGYHHRGWDASNLHTIPRHIYNYTVPADYNDTRRGYVDTGFMEEILTNKTLLYLNSKNNNNTSTTTTRSGTSSTTTASASSSISVPITQIGPRLTNTSIVMMDLFAHPVFKKEIIASLEYDVPVISELEDLEFLLENVLESTNASETNHRDYGEPRSFTLDPVKADFGDDAVTVGYVVGILRWSNFFRNFFPENTKGIYINVESDCGRTFTYVINTGKPDQWYTEGLGLEERGNYQHLEERFKFFWKDHPKGTSRHCHFDLAITPTDEFANSYLTKTPVAVAIIMVALFLGAAIVFIIYDHFNVKQKERISQEKERAKAVVTSLFPEKVADKLLEEQQQRTSNAGGGGGNHHHSTNRGDADEWKTDHQEERAKPLAELFPSATIMFADIKGFTAWSSDRSPTDVFQLLETIYGAMDEIAKKRKVFKIETIGDCYVAVCGLPRQRDDHAVVMAKFAKGCLEKFREIVTMLEVDLPGTSKLELRTGLHSGPVTAGVLRGDRARFQLFGDTVNTTARHESTGEGSRIHLSVQFVDELIKFGKGHWAVPREDKVYAKGKGTLDTFWLQIRESEFRAASTIMTADSDTTTESTTNTKQKSDRFIQKMLSMSTIDPSHRHVLSDESSSSNLPPHRQVAKEEATRSSSLGVLHEAPETTTTTRSSSLGVLHEAPETTTTTRSSSLGVLDEAPRNTGARVFRSNREQFTDECSV